MALAEELEGVGLTDVGTVLAAFFADPSHGRELLRERLLVSLVTAADTEAAAGRIPRALTRLNQLLALSPEDPRVAELGVRLRAGERRQRRLRQLRNAALATAAVVAAVALGRAVVVRAPAPVASPAQVLAPTAVAAPAVPPSTTPGRSTPEVPLRSRQPPSPHPPSATADPLPGPRRCAIRSWSGPTGPCRWTTASGAPRSLRSTHSSSSPDITSCG